MRTVRKHVPYSGNMGSRYDIFFTTMMNECNFGDPTEKVEEVRDQHGMLKGWNITTELETES